jgi:hypothetical protein
MEISMFSLFLAPGFCKVPEIDNLPTNTVKIGHADAYLLMTHATKNSKLGEHLTSLILLLSCFVDYAASYEDGPKRLLKQSSEGTVRTIHTIHAVQTVHSCPELPTTV